MSGFTESVRRLADRVSHWTPSRWAASSAVDGVGAGRTRADVVYELVQRIADAAADAEGQPRRVVPRLPADQALADQLRVVAADLVAAAPEPGVVESLGEAVDAVRRGLSPRMT